MPRKGYGWYYHPPKPPKPKVPKEIKEKIKAISDEFVKSVLKPKYMICDTSYNEYYHIEEIYTKWWRNFFYFYSKYHYTRQNAIQEFVDSGFARLEYVSEDNFNLSYMRHTGKWWEIFVDLSLEECLETIEEMPHFNP